MERKIDQEMTREEFLGYFLGNIGTIAFLFAGVNTYLKVSQIESVNEQTRDIRGRQQKVVAELATENPDIPAVEDELTSLEGDLDQLKQSADQLKQEIVRDRILLISGTAMIMPGLCFLAGVKFNLSKNR